MSAVASLHADWQSVANGQLLGVSVPLKMFGDYRVRLYDDLVDSAWFFESEQR